MLALILGYFSKYSPEDPYVLADNKNLPVYLFMAVVVALFTGMSVSAEEIHKDRRILERESFLNLSRFSYINSKIFFLFCLSGIQMLLFVLVGNYVLEIHGMTWYYWVILFSTSCLANLIGLNISAALNSIITIYILIPFILVPQLLLGGAMIRFDELHKSISKQLYVPFTGDIMASRWAYEALAVAQFKHNGYQKHFFEAEKAKSEASFQRSYVLPRLESITRQILNDSTNYAAYAQDFKLLENETHELARKFDINLFAFVSSLNPDFFSQAVGERYLNYLNRLEVDFQEMYRQAVSQKDSTYEALIRKYGKKDFYRLKQEHYNENLADILENRNDFHKIIQAENRLIQKKDPVYLDPYTNYGRAHFYAPVKVVGDFKIDTVWFNIFVLWLMTAILYLALLDNTLKKIIGFFSGGRNKK